MKARLIKKNANMVKVHNYAPACVSCLTASLHAHTENQSVNQWLCVMEPESFIDFPEQKGFYNLNLLFLSLASHSFHFHVRSTVP